MTDTLVPQPLLLPGQAAAPPGPCDMTGMYVMHHAFRRDLARFATAVRRTPLDEHGTWRALADRWARFAHELHEHHTKEDVGIWPLLLERVDDADRSVLVAMEAEHGLVDPLLERVGAGLARLAQAPRADVTEGERTDLADTVAELRTALDQHLSHEEQDAIRIIQAHVTAEEWADLEARVLRGNPTPRQMLFMLPWATDDLPQEAVDRLLGGAPAPVRWFHALGRRSYALLDRRAFAHA
ncbi:iron-sulfur cluster repair protein YtfE (RIC family) [Nocardioides cavernae]|uniref:Iron-sulfur cluster repair protein YtfE (RIC family) n=1 Tax=Nocardioides cavernae TaxID=1921566 RepID=A0A7Y9KQW2_9ACTN|nr:hemerythrin domain-containing protein [Nocardioides cavernae]NYE36010.1 iron-sulfur cluster repair protein YtfE (RIC family) [Nocardioides cavernae]